MPVPGSTKSQHATQSCLFPDPLRASMGSGHACSRVRPGRARDPAMPVSGFPQGQHAIQLCLFPGAPRPSMRPSHASSRAFWSTVRERPRAVLMSRKNSQFLWLSGKPRVVMVGTMGREGEHASGTREAPRAVRMTSWAEDGGYPLDFGQCRRMVRTRSLPRCSPRPMGATAGNDGRFRGNSSAGRAPRSQCGGPGFDPPLLHNSLMFSSVCRA